MKRLGHIFALIADILAIVGFFLALFIAFRVFPNCNNTEFDYQAILVGIICGVFTLLVGWNIYQAIDWKNEISRIDNLRNELEKQLNYIHNKSDYNQAITYAMLSQTASAHFAPNENDVLKYQMLTKGIAALKTLSAFPDCNKEIKSLVNTLITGLSNSSDIHLSDKIKTDLILSCGEIKNRNNISRFDELIKTINRL